MTDYSPDEPRSTIQPPDPDELAMLNRARSLPLQLQPPPRLWDNIAQAIEPHADPTVEANQSWLRPFAWAAAAVLVVAVGSLLLKDVVEPQAPLGDGVAMVAADAQLVPVQLPQMRERMLGMLDTEFADLPPAVRETVRHNLQVITTAREDIERALGVHPNDPLLRRLLMANYGNELKLLQNLESISRQQQQRIQL